MAAVPVAPEGVVRVALEATVPVALALRGLAWHELAAEGWPSARPQRSARAMRERRPAAFDETMTPILPGQFGSSGQLVPRPAYAAQTEPFVAIERQFTGSALVESGWILAA